MLRRMAVCFEISPGEWVQSDLFFNYLAITIHGVECVSWDMLGKDRHFGQTV